jgi:tRNA-dihydrouridine synthase A
LNYKDKTFAVAPMMDWTDRHCRVFHRSLSRHAVLYSEMVTALAVKHGDRQKLLGFDPVEQPVVLQLGGSDPLLLAEASKVGEDFGYAEINLNVGCPSDRVQGGHFGACLMAEPRLVADCIEAMQSAVKIPVTVKCRIGIDEQDEETALEDFIQTVFKSGCTNFTIHARKAWLKGLSPKENREIPPLNYDRVLRLKATHPTLAISINGGLETVEQGIPLLEKLDGIMLGRAAYHNPWILAGVDPIFAGVAPAIKSRREAVLSMLPYIENQVAQGQSLHRIVRHMLGLYHKQPGGRIWRHILTVESVKPGATTDVVLKALEAVEEQAARVAEIRAA